MVDLHEQVSRDEPDFEGPFLAAYADGADPSTIPSFCAHYYDTSLTFMSETFCNTDAKHVELTADRCGTTCELGQGPRANRCEWCNGNVWDEGFLFDGPNLGRCAYCDFHFFELSCVWCPNEWFIVPFDENPFGCVEDCAAHGGIEVSSADRGYEIQVPILLAPFYVEADQVYCMTCPEGCPLENC